MLAGWVFIPLVADMVVSLIVKVVIKVVMNEVKKGLSIQQVSRIEI